MNAENKYQGGYFDDFLRGQGIFDEVDAVATKRVIAWQLLEEMKKQGLTKVKMAQKMGTSRSSLDRLLNPSNDSLALQTLQRAAQALGKQVQIQLV